METIDNIMMTLGHAGFTTLTYVASHWSGIGAGILMLLQGAYLIKKLRSK